jgi:hypothetical protein
MLVSLPSPSCLSSPHPPVSPPLTFSPLPGCPQVIKDKDSAVRGQDFEKAGQLRDKEMELKAKIQAVMAGERGGEGRERGEEHEQWA